MNLIPVPRDFKRVAVTMTVTELRRRYKRGDYTIRRWCAISGVAPRLGRKYAERPWRFKQPDTPEQVEMCLNCAFPDCRGWCVKMKAAKEAVKK